jgi:hypothetical protein
MSCRLLFEGRGWSGGVGKGEESALGSGRGHTLIGQTVCSSIRASPLRDCPV